MKLEEPNNPKNITNRYPAVLDNLRLKLSKQYEFFLEKMNGIEQKKLEKAALFLLIEGQKMRENLSQSKKRLQTKLQAAREEMCVEKSKRLKLEQLIVETCVRQKKGCVHDKPDQCRHEICNRLGAKIANLLQNTESSDEELTSDSD